MAISLDRIVVQARVEARLLSTLASGVVTAEVDEVGFTFTPETALASGTSANQADRVLFKADTEILSAASVDLNLYSGANWDGLSSGKDLLGNTLTNVELVALLIHNRAASAGTLVIGGEGTANAWSAPFGASNTSVVGILPGGTFQLFAPTNPAWAVGSSSNNLLRLEASGGDVTYRAVALMRSA